MTIIYCEKALKKNISMNFPSLSENQQIQSHMQSQIPQASSPPTQGIMPQENYESLLKCMQLLRIAQLRYIVQKFSLPASGNKTKLLSLILQILKSLRYSPILYQIQTEVNHLLTEQNESFSDTLSPPVQLQISAPNPEFIVPNFPLYTRASPDFIFGPINIPVGLSTGKFSFATNPTNNFYFIDFAYPGGVVTPFEMYLQIDGFSFEVSINDPFPQPLDITQCLQNNFEMMHIFSINKANATAPMQVAVHMYQQIDLEILAGCLLGIHLTPGLNHIVSSSICQHQFSIIPYMSNGLASNHWNCPICGKNVPISEVKYISSYEKKLQKPLFTNEDLAEWADF